MPGYFISSLHSVPRAAFGVAMLTLLRGPFLEGDAPTWRTPDQGLRPRQIAQEAESKSAGWVFP